MSVAHIFLAKKLNIDFHQNVPKLLAATVRVRDDPPNPPVDAVGVRGEQKKFEINITHTL
jgi:hypothetical protein